MKYAQQKVIAWNDLPIGTHLDGKKGFGSYPHLIKAINLKKKQGWENGLIRAHPCKPDSQSSLLRLMRWK